MSKEEKNSVSYQAYDDYEHLDPSSAERDLLRAVLLGALQDIKKDGSEKRKATEFFLSPDDDYIFSFLSICDFLNIDPTKVLMVAGIEKSAKGYSAEALFKELGLD